MNALCIHCEEREREAGVYCGPCWEQAKARAALAALAARYVPVTRLWGGTSLKVQRAIDWHGEDWCGIKPPRGAR